MADDKLGDATQYGIACRMAPAVIDVLEVIHVDEQRGERPVMTLRRGTRLQKALFEIATVVHTGERIGESDLFQSRMIDTVFQADRNNHSQMFEKIGCGVGAEAQWIIAAE